MFEFPVNFRDLQFRRGEAFVVVYDVRGEIALQVERHLCVNPEPGLLVREPAKLDQATELGLLAAPDDDHPVHPQVRARFYEERCVEDRHRARVGLLYLDVTAGFRLEDKRVDYPLEYRLLSPRPVPRT